ncbi:MAG: GGDEF domain-containing protein [Candidatus Omnitrophota bacterium]
MKILKPDDFERKHSPLKLLLILIFAILICDLIIGHLFLLLPIPKSPNIILIESIMLVIILSPVLYQLLYKPLSIQFDKLKKAEVIQRELSLIDELTKLYNRRGFLLYANHLLKLSNRMQRGLVLIYADLDGLKHINDKLGHKQGDTALMCIAKVLHKTFRGSDVIGRIGGDEFAILALELKAESLDILRKRVKENLKLAMRNSNFKYKLTVSLGMMYYHPEKPQTIEELLDKADKLMYEEKNSKGNVSSIET